MISKIKTTILISIFSISTIQADVNWHTYKEAFKLSLNKQLTKDVFVMLSADNCRYCTKMKKAIKNDKGVQKSINNKYYPVLINSSRDFTPIDLDIGITPSFFILSKKDLSIKKEPIKGFMDPRVLLRRIK